MKIKNKNIKSEFITYIKIWSSNAHISALMQKLTFCLGIEQAFIAVFHPQSNPVEGKKRSKSSIAKNPKEWNFKLPSIRFALAFHQLI